MASGFASQEANRNIGDLKPTLARIVVGGGQRSSDQGKQKPRPKPGQGFDAVTKPLTRRAPHVENSDRLSWAARRHDSITDLRPAPDRGGPVGARRSRRRSSPAAVAALGRRHPASTAGSGTADGLRPHRKGASLETSARVNPAPFQRTRFRADRALRQPACCCVPVSSSPACHRPPRNRPAAPAGCMRSSTPASA